MTKTVYLSTLFIILGLLPSCNGTNNRISKQLEGKQALVKVNNDSIQLTTLVRQAYEWHMTKRIDDFPYKYEKPSDTIFIGIDWDVYNKTADILKKTNFFTTEFLIYHKTIALNIDSSIVKADISWRNRNDGIALWDLDADYWCGCQDYPDNYWEIMTIDSLIFETNSVSFYWTWDKNPNTDSYKYKMTAKKENDQWKINFMEGFNYFSSVDQYDKIMNK